MKDARTLFEAELRRRGLKFSIDAESGRHAIVISGGDMLVSLQNLQREFANDGDTGRVVRFVDAIEASANADRQAIDASRLYWCLEPADHVEKADFLAPVSERVDRVLCHWTSDQLITWVSPQMLEKANLDRQTAEARAFENLDLALREAKIETSDIDGVALGMLGSELPFKSSLILAPGARSVLEPVLGWPLLAITPDRNFLYLWAERHAEFAGRVGSVAVREYLEAGYPISTEVFRLDDSGVEAIGAFPIPERP